MIRAETLQAADVDGSGELDIDEFSQQMGPLLGANLTQQQIAQLFMKIDADAGGTVDWDEFTNYMFSEGSGAPCTSTMQRCTPPSRCGGCCLSAARLLPNRAGGFACHPLLRC